MADPTYTCPACTWPAGTVLGTGDGTGPSPQASGPAPVPAPTEGEWRPWNRASATQVELYRRCARSWAFRYTFGHRSPSTPSQEAGSQIHGILERRAKGAALTEKELRQVEVAVPHLPDPALYVSKDLLVEHEIHLPTGVKAADGSEVSFLGFLDYLMSIVLYYGRAFETLIAVAAKYLIGDYKTTSNLRYAKTPEELAESVQMAVYAEWAFRAIKGVGDRVALRHLNLELSAPSEAKDPEKNGERRVKRALPVLTEVTRLDTARRWASITSTIGDMVETSKMRDPLQVLPNPDACGDYGGCPHRQKCGFLTTTTHPTKGNGLMGGLLDGLRDAKAQQAAATAATAGLLGQGLHVGQPTAGAAGAPAGGLLSGLAQAAPILTPPVALTPPVTLTPPHPLTGGLLGFAAGAGGLLAAPAAAPVHPAVPGQPFPGSVVQGGGLVAGLAAQVGGGLLASAPQAVVPSAPRMSGLLGSTPAGAPVTAGEGTIAILPPDAPSRTSTKEEVEVAAQDANKRKKRLPKTTAAPPAAAVAGPAAAVVAPAAGGLLGSAPMSGGLLGAAAGGLLATPPAAAQAPEVPALPLDAVPAPAALRSFILCVGGYPIKTGGITPVLLEDWIAPLLEPCAQAMQVPDIHVLGYKAKDVLAVAIRDRLKTEAPPELLVINDAGAFGAAEAIAALTPLATFYFRRG